MNILAALKSEASKLHRQLDTLDSAMKILGGKNSVNRGKRGKRGKKRHMSASARARIAKAQRARWAKIKAARRSA